MVGPSAVPAVPQSNLIAAHVRISSRALPASEISRVLRVPSVWSAERGASEPIGKMRGRRRQEHVWVLSTERVEEILGQREVSSLVSDVVLRVEPRFGELLGLTGAQDLQVQVICEAWIRADHMPCFDFDSSLVARVARLGARWTWDFYWWPERHGQSPPQ
jgi:hypothetical protein